MAGKILAVVENLFFLAKIQHAAQEVNITVESALPEDLSERLVRKGAAAVFLDLNHRSGKAVEVLQAIKGNSAISSVPVVAFLPHVEGDLARTARAAGCDVVLARSAFSQQLPQLLKKYAG